MLTTVGTANNDTLYCKPNSNSIGLAGNDTFYTIDTPYDIHDEFYTLYGGSGNDTYFVSETPTFILDTSGSQDLLSFDLPDTTSLYVVDGKHLLITDYDDDDHITDDWVGIADAFGNGKVEFIYSTDENRYYDFDQFWVQNQQNARYVSWSFFADQPWLNQAQAALQLETQNTSAEAVPVGFNEGYYDSLYDDISAAIDAQYILTGGAHYATTGKYEGRSPNIAYDQHFYLTNNPDVAAAVQQGVITGYDHFIYNGQYEGRQGSAAFNEQAYLQANQDVAVAVQQGWITGTQHFLLYGQYEGRSLGNVAPQSIDLVGVEIPAQDIVPQDIA